MPPKHSAPLLRPSRAAFVAVLAILVGLVVWVAARAASPQQGDGRQPILVMPSVSPVPVGAIDSPTSGSIAITLPAAPHSSSPSPTPSPSATSRQPSQSPSTRVPSKSPKPTTAPPKTVFASVSTTSSWDGGYVGRVLVTNKGTLAVNWTVTVAHAGQDGIQLTATWGASGSQRGTNFVFTGATLGPGTSTSFGYQATKRGGGTLGPTGCSVVVTPAG